MPFRSLIVALGLWPVLVFAQAGEISIEGAWVRALPPTQPNTAAYLSIVNEGLEAVTVTGASADLSGRVEFHTTREVDGYMRMEQLPELTVAAGSKLELAPGATHLMLLDLERMPEPGESIELCLTLASGRRVCAQAPVRKSAQPDDHQHHHH